MGKDVEFYFDFGSPTAYLAWTQLPQLCAEEGARLLYRPLLLGGVFQATGNSSPAGIPAKMRYMLQDLERYARRYRVPLRFNPHFPINTLPLMRLATALQLQQPQRLEVFIALIFKALWVDGRNLGDPAELADCLNQGGFDPQQLLQLSTQPETKAALKSCTDNAIARGVFGAPSLFVGDTLFFGQDRLEFVREALRG